jgi:hypothetical protein
MTKNRRREGTVQQANARNLAVRKTKRRLEEIVGAMAKR